MNQMSHMSPVQTRTYTPADLLAMPDSNHIELVNGQLVEKSVNALSSFVEVKISARLENFCDARKMAVVCPRPTASGAFRISL
jgi:hypothetical protein